MIVKFLYIYQFTIFIVDITQKLQIETKIEKNIYGNLFLSGILLINGVNIGLVKFCALLNTYASSLPLLFDISLSAMSVTFLGIRKLGALNELHKKRSSQWICFFFKSTFLVS